MKPVFNLESKYRVTMLTKNEWTRVPGTPRRVKGLVWFADGSRTAEGTASGVYRQFVNGRFRISLGKPATVFQAGVYAILDCVQEIENQDQPEKYVSICYDSQGALKALQAVKRTSPLVQHCQQTLKDISARNVVGLYWVPWHAGLTGNKIANKLARNGSALLSSSLDLSFLGGF